MPGVKRSWTDDDVRAAVSSSTSWKQVSRCLGLSTGGQSYAKVKQVAERLGLDTSHFRGMGWNKGLGRGRDPVAARAAKKRWYDNHRDVYAQRNTKNRRRRIDLVRELKDKPCADCGNRFPYFIMEFDHRPGENKEFSIGNGAARTVGLKRLLGEIDKCDLVCVLCHRYRTARRLGWTEDSETVPEVLLLADDA